MAFVTGLLLSLIASMPISAAQYPHKVIIIGALIGATAGIGLFGIALSARDGVPVSIINPVASLALAIPILLALIFYREIPGIRQAIGLLLSLIAIVLLQRSAVGSPDAFGRGAPPRILTTLWMMFIFLGTGLAQFFQARLHLAGLDVLRRSALVMMYLAGTVFPAGTFLLLRGRMERSAWKYGVAVGLASYAGNSSVLRAFVSLPSHVVFPVVVCGPIILTALYSRVFEGEKLNRHQLFGMVIGIAAVLLLAIS